MSESKYNEPFDPSWYNIRELPLDEAVRVPMVEMFINKGLYPENAQELTALVIESNPYMMIHNVESSLENDDDIMLETFLHAYQVTHGNTNLMFEALSYGTLDYACEGIIDKLADTDTGKAVRRAANTVKHTVSPVISGLIDTVNNFVKWDAEKDREMVITGSFFLKARYLFKKILMYSVASSLVLSIPAPILPLILLKITGYIVLPFLKWKEIFGAGYKVTAGDGYIGPDKVKNRVIQELELELKMTREKIDDAKAAGDKQAKYALMRTENKIELEITRIKTHGLV